MQKVDTTRIEMIRRREPEGFRYLNRSFLAKKVAGVPDIDDLAELAGSGWWDDESTMQGFVQAHNGQAGPVETRLRVVFDGDAIFAAFHMEEPRMDKTNAIITQPGTRQVEPVDPVSGQMPMAYVIEKDDHVTVSLDFTHQHGRFVRFFVNLAGVGYAAQAEVSYPTEAVYPRRTFSQPWRKPYRCRVIKGDDYWCAAFRIPWSSAGVDPHQARVMGINATRCRTVGQMVRHCLCFAPFDDQSAMEFGDLYLGSQPIELEEIDFGRPVLDDNRFTFKLRNACDRELSLHCRARLVVERDGHEMSDDGATVRIEPGRTAQVEMGYTLDWQEGRRQTLTLVVSDASGEELLTSRYFFSYSQDITAEQPHAFDGPQPDPDPDDEDFIVKKRRFLLSRIPYFQRATTQEGAPSDFTLRSTCGKWEFNLMKPGVLKEVAAMIEEIFDDPNDRLAAATLLAHQKSFSMHMAPHTALHSQITPLSALRLNAGHCYSRALVWMGIARNISAADGEGIYGDRAHCILVLHHVMGCIDVGDDDRWIFDPTPGTFFYAWDNRRFATEKELEADPSLPARMVPARVTPFTNIRYHRPIPAGQVVFPQGAPAD